MKLNYQSINQSNIEGWNYIYIKKISSQLSLTHQTLNLDHETVITLYKANRNKLWSLILNQSNDEKMKLKKNSITKMNLEKPDSIELTYKTYDPGYEIR